jgi:hypothetical protein
MKSSIGALPDRWRKRSDRDPDECNVGDAADVEHGDRIGRSMVETMA